MTKTVHDFTADRLNGGEQKLSDFDGEVLLIVNTASKCGMTPQYEGLQKLHEDYGDKGLTILGFPCNQFGSQEPGDGEQIADFCQVNYGVSFPMFAKISVNGNATHPLYRFLKKAAPGLMGSQNIKWNFTKFLVNKRGEVVERFAPTTKPADITGKIKALL